jgi:hypothetical protein
VKRLAWCLLALAGLLANGTELGFFGRPVPPNLERLAGRSFGAFAPVETIAVAPENLGDQPPLRRLFHSYRAPDGAQGVMFAAYYPKDRRWSGRPHPVELCFAADGWALGEQRVLRAASGALYRSSELSRSEQRIRLVHWLQHPGALPGEGLLESLRRRVSRASALRRDVLSVYWEFDSDAAPSDEVMTAACEQMREAVEALWR